MTHLLIVEGGNQVNEAARLKDMYTSPFSVARINYIEARADYLDIPWFIFSANYGMSTPLMNLKPYGKRFDSLDDEDRVMLARRTAKKLKEDYKIDKKTIEYHGSDIGLAILLDAIERAELKIKVLRPLTSNLPTQRKFYEDSLKMGSVGTEAEIELARADEEVIRQWEDLDAFEKAIVFGWEKRWYGAHGKYFGSDPHANKKGDKKVADFLKEQGGDLAHTSTTGVKIRRKELCESLHKLPEQWKARARHYEEDLAGVEDAPTEEDVLVWDDLTIEQQIVVYGAKRMAYVHSVDQGDMETAKWATSNGKPLMKATIAQARNSMCGGDPKVIAAKFSHCCKWDKEGLPWALREKIRPTDKPAQQVDLLGGPQPIETTPKTTDIVVGEEQPPEGVVILSAEEDALLERLENTIQEGLETFRQVGEALTEIHAKKLWRAYGFETFREYLDVRWSFKKSYAHYLMKSAQIAGELEDQGIEPPKTEAVARELAKAPKEERAEVLEETRERTGKEEPTAKEVKETIEARAEGREPDDNRPPPKESWKDTYGTPARYVFIGDSAMGGIDLDPATNVTAQGKIVKAKKFYTIDDNGLEQPWAGRVWLNPPFSNPKVWAEKLLNELDEGNVTAATMLINTDNSTQCWRMLAMEAKWVAFPPERISFWLDEPSNERRGNEYCQTMFFFGEINEEAIEQLIEQNWVVLR